MREPSVRFWEGAAFGLIGTLAMSIVMAVVYVAGAQTLAQPIPLGLVSLLVMRITGLGLAGATAIAIPIFFAYGAVWMGLLDLSTHRFTWGKGVVVGLGMWALMMVFLVPFAGANAFRAATSPVMWISTLVMHVVYGATAGLVAERHEPHHHAHEPL